MPSISVSLGDLARTIPVSTRVFLRHKLDFCCGGKQSLADACAAAGLDAQVILDEVEAEVRRADGSAGWGTRSLGDLADHIEAHYHAALRRDVPHLIEAARKVERVHAEKPTVPAGLADVLAEFWAKMLSHMQKEERVLFPMIRRGARGEAVYMPIRVMESEHDEHGETLAKIRALTNDLQPPPGACATWRTLYQALATLEAELMEHISLENNVLFLRATREG
ncbi:MAG TPA: iron-sulfur cluster repair protein YtfE [Kofleriaceae bacterium]|nr:iron-sulfur cluster repair protein YtfE [Kofleriaceae bacterium]